MIGYAPHAPRRAASGRSRTTPTHTRLARRRPERPPTATNDPIPRWVPQPHVRNVVTPRARSAPNEAIPRKAKNGPDATVAGDDEWRRRVEAEEAAQEGEPPPLPPASEDDRARRPPAQLTSAQVAAAVRLGMQSAGLSWLQRAAAADAATSAAGPRGAEDDPPSREPKGRADADVPLIGEPPKHAREVILHAGRLRVARFRLHRFL